MTSFISKRSLIQKKTNLSKKVKKMLQSFTILRLLNFIEN